MGPEQHQHQLAAAAAAAQVANPLPEFVPGRGPSRPGEGWAHVKILHSADMKASWECNFCKKVVSGENQTRVSNSIYHTITMIKKIKFKST